MIGCATCWTFSPRCVFGFAPKIRRRTPFKQVEKCRMRSLINDGLTGAYDCYPPVFEGSVSSWATALSVTVSPTSPFVWGSVGPSRSQRLPAMSRKTAT
jgi:hypothetical protein